MAFKLTEAVPVDLFPQTPHCELVMKFERNSRKKSRNDLKADQDGAAGSDKPKQCGNSKKFCLPKGAVLWMWARFLFCGVCRLARASRVVSDGASSRVEMESTGSGTRLEAVSTECTEAEAEQTETVESIHVIDETVKCSHTESADHIQS